MQFSNRHAGEDEVLPKMLFYSVLIHYAFVYLFFGNPFLILNTEDDSAASMQSIDIQLLNFPTKTAINLPVNGSSENKALVARALQKDDFNPSGKTAAPSTRTTDREDTENAAEFPKLQEPDTRRKHETADETGDDMTDLDERVQAALTPVAKKIVRMPPSMTGPEDCMLKVVGMVCPEGKIGCITAYRDFCASLPR